MGKHKQDMQFRERILYVLIMQARELFQITGNKEYDQDLINAMIDPITLVVAPGSDDYVAVVSHKKYDRILKGGCHEKRS